MYGWMDGWMGVKAGLRDCLAQSKNLKNEEKVSQNFRTLRPKIIIRGQSHQTFYTLGQIYKHVLKCDNVL